MPKKQKDPKGPRVPLSGGFVASQNASPYSASFARINLDAYTHSAFGLPASPTPEPVMPAEVFYNRVALNEDLDAPD